MKQTKLIMGMPITIEIVDKNATKKDLNEVFDYFSYVDEKFSTYKSTSEVSQINDDLLEKTNYSSDMKKVLLMCEETKQETNGYFDIVHDGKIDPSGIVKGWAIQNACTILKKRRFKDFYVEAGGDIQVSGKNTKGENWTIGIRNPFNTTEVIKVINIFDKGVATSGTYLRGKHIYNPHENKEADEIVSLTVIGPNVYEADRFATAAFAMGEKGIYFIENLLGFEGYMVDKKGIATSTSGFNSYILLENTLLSNIY